MSKEKQTTELEKFLRDKLESEIQNFGDGITEFHTRDLNQLINILDSKDKETSDMQKEIDELKRKLKQETYNTDYVLREYETLKQYADEIARGLKSIKHLVENGGTNQAYYEEYVQINEALDNYNNYSNKSN